MEIVHVHYHRDTECWWADSPEIQGWTATAASVDELRGLIEDGVRFALEREDVLIEHVLDYDVPAAAFVVFDFVAGQTVVAGTSGAAADRQLAGAHWHPTPA